MQTMMTVRRAIQELKSVDPTLFDPKIMHYLVLFYTDSPWAKIENDYRLADIQRTAPIDLYNVLNPPLKNHFTQIKVQEIYNQINELYLHGAQNIPLNVVRYMTAAYSIWCMTYFHVYKCIYAYAGFKREAPTNTGLTVVGLDTNTQRILSGFLIQVESIDPNDVAFRTSKKIDQNLINYMTAVMGQLWRLWKTQA